MRRRRASRSPAIARSATLNGAAVSVAGLSSSSMVISSRTLCSSARRRLSRGASHGDDLEALADHHLDGRRKSTRGDRDQPGDGQPNALGAIFVLPAVMSLRTLLMSVLVRSLPAGSL